MKSGSKTWIVTVCLIGIATWITISPVKLLYVTYYGFFRYSYEYLFGLEDRTNNLPIEREIFSQFYRFPYLYIYGPSGYTKMNFIAFRGSIEKIPNKGFYDNVPIHRGDGIQGTLEDLHQFYGSRFLVRESWNEVKLEDRLIYAKLQEEGKRKLALQGKLDKNDSRSWIVEERKRWDGLVKLNEELYESLKYRR